MSYSEEEKKRESRFSMIDHIKQRMITGSIIIHLLEYNLLKYNWQIIKILVLINAEIKSHCLEHLCNFM